MELTIEQALQQGVGAHKEGKLQEAERLYHAILQAQPAHPDANHNLGVIAVSVNKAGAALPLFKTALEANPKIDPRIGTDTKYWCIRRRIVRCCLRSECHGHSDW